MPNEIELTIDGLEVETFWWTKDVGELFCALCGKKDSDNCVTCQNKNPWCG